MSGTNSFITTEYCTTSYSKKDFKLIKYAKPVFKNREKWDWKNG